MNPATYILLGAAFALLVFALIMFCEQKYYGKAKKVQPMMGSREELIASLQQEGLSDPRQNDFPGPKSQRKGDTHDTTVKATLSGNADCAGGPVRYAGSGQSSGPQH